MMRIEALRTGTVRRLGGGRLRLLAVVIGMLGCCVLLGLTARSAMAYEDFSGGAYDILPPGAEGGLGFTEFSRDQSPLYQALTPKKGNVTQEMIEQDFLPEKFGDIGTKATSVENPEPGLEIVNDQWDIPHVYGQTRAEVMYGSGWIAARDRGLLLALGLGPAYTAALGVPGINAFGLLLEDRSFKPSAEAIAYVEGQKKSLEEKGAEGDQVIEDLEDWVEGVNAAEPTLPPIEQVGRKVTLADAIAGFAFIGSIFGNGGGGEVQNSEFLSRLETKYGTKSGEEVFRDLREVNDPEAPTTGTKEFSYDAEPTEPTPGALLVEPGSASYSARKDESKLLASRRKMSNFLLAGASDAANGHPKAVMGPQLGYYYPEIVMQADLHGPGIDAQGIIAPIAPYVFIGRGRDFAWSLTSEDGENEQEFLEKLCNEDASPPTRESTSYVYNGECVPMHHFDAGEIGASHSEPAHEVYFWESVHGPIMGTVMVEGEPYAIALDRSTRGREPAGEVAFSKLDSDKVHNPQEFFEAANELETTFNMAYIDDEHIAYFSTGRLPVTAAGTNPQLPTLGTGQYDWKGFLTLEQHPHEVDPASGYLTNWNNKPAPGWAQASDNWAWGPIDRVQMFKGFTTGMTEASDVSIMNRAATQDLRAVEVWPTIERVLDTPGASVTPFAQEAVKKVRAWVRHGASRYGKNGPKAAAAAIMDAIWTPIGEAVLGPVLGELLPEFESLDGPSDNENSQGSSFGGGWYGYVYKSLREVLGETVAQPFSRGYCGSGSLEACRNALWAAIETGVNNAASQQGTTNMKKWRAEKVRINLLPGIDPETLTWTNRSTFQQVIEFTGHAEE